MAFIVEKDWITRSGLRAVCTVGRRQDGTLRHRCGYVGVPTDNPLHGLHYGDESPLLADAFARLKDTPMCEIEHSLSFSRMIGMLFGGFEPRLDIVISVHGGITYSRGGDGYPVKGDEWWFGFDCNHCDDSPIEYGPGEIVFRNGVVRDLDYVVGECESMAEQLQGITQGAKT